MNIKISVIIIAVIVIGALVGYFIWESGSYVAKVGNHKILNHEYTFFLRTLKKTAEAEAGAYSEKEVKELWENPAGGEDPVAIIMNRALENAKEFKIQLIMAERERFKLSDSELGQIRQSLDSLLDDKEYANFLKYDLGLKPAQYKDMMIKRRLVEKYIDNYLQTHNVEISQYNEKLEEWKNDPVLNLVKNERVLQKVTNKNMIQPK
jgi:foldase protein PrsA